MARKVKAGEAYVRLSLDDKIQQGLNKASKRMQSFGRSVAVAGAGLAALGGVIITPIIAASKNFADFGNNLGKASARTGIAVKSLSELKFAAEQSGTGIEKLETGIRGMQRGIFDASRGTGELRDVLDELGMSFEDLKGLSPEEQFQLLGDRIGQVDDATIKAALAMKTFGEDGLGLIPLFGNIKTLREEAKALGITMSREDATSAEALTDAMNRLNRVFLAIKVNIGAAVAPLLSELSTKLSYALGEVIKFIKANKEFIVSMLKIGAIITAVGGALIGIGGSIAIAGFAFSGLATAVGLVSTVLLGIVGILAAIASPVGIAIAALATLGYAFVEYTEMGANAMNWLKTQLAGISEYISNLVGFIAKAFQTGGIDLAVKALWASIKVIFYEGVVYINGIWQGVYENAMHAWNQITTGISNALQTISQVGLNAANFIAKTLWSASQSIIDAFAYVTKSVAKSLYLTKAISGNTYGDIVEEIRQLQEAGKDFAENQKNKAKDVYGDSVEASQKRQQDNQKAYAEEAKKIADKFADSGKGLKDELEKAKAEYQKIADIVNEIPEETSRAVEKLTSGIEKTGVGGGSTGVNISSAGTFNALAARGLSVSGIDVVAKNTAKTAKYTEQIANKDSLAFG